MKKIAVLIPCYNEELTVSKVVKDFKKVLSDADIKRVEAALPSLSDTYEQKVAKMKGIYNLLDIKKGNFDGGKQVGKYKVTVK